LLLPVPLPHSAFVFACPSERSDRTETPTLTYN
jgi:hypothetical protein